MKKLLLILILGFGLSSLQAAAYEKVAKFRGVKVLISSDKPLVVGNNNLEFTITKNGKTISGAKVSIKAFMPSMPGMPYMEDKNGFKETSTGHYKGRVNFGMSGTWQLHIFIAPKSGKKMRVKTSLNV